MFPCTTAGEEEEKIEIKIELRKKAVVEEVVLKIWGLFLIILPWFAG